MTFGSIKKALEFVAARWGIRLTSRTSMYSGYASDTPKDYERGPRFAGLSFHARTVYLVRRDSPEDVLHSGPEDVLHEMVHVVLGPDSCRGTVSEGFVLMPFEWAVANWIAKHLKRSDRITLLEACEEYQATTSVIGARDMDDFGGREAPWWREGQERVIAAGLLTTGLVPTWETLDARGSEELHRGALSWENTMAPLKKFGA